ncbi:Rha family transcriptional regulator [Companilactobacillus futsaii]|uniref:Rha family transcriptional regulator n=2 Tax=Companilactobacillus futsaii TaxID=938155 RepID=A0A5B7T5E7_9LACO|nr:Rha family transcriptional regulator [Companilactobacillus futsaii]KRK95074.1 putative phage protein [Companilactobacillus futsaii JCM 17355]QCX25749.1 Rha family transcriptional regulator [Companilactobacillus futsaii]
MSKLVFVNSALVNEVPYTTSNIIARQMKLNERTVMHRINQYKDRLEHFGNIEFCTIIDQNSQGGRPKKVAHLNEQQATLLITFFKNTKTVADFKEELVKQFYDMEHELTRRQVYKDLEKPVRRSLTDAIKEWPNNNKWSYKLFTDLICKAVTGMNTKQLKQSRKVNKNATGTEIYTSDELAKYQQIETKIITLIDLGMTYEDIKAVINNQTVTIKLVKKDVKKDLLPSQK